MTTAQAWISAARLRTLPLALSSILLGSFLAAYAGAFRWEVMALAILTTICLQVLSNLANDYGDSKHGADSAERKGPERAVQSGIITSTQMKHAMALFVVFSFVSGIALLIVALGWNLKLFLVFLLLGVAAIAAAVYYTSGDKPYGYVGLGDFSVLVFFGFVGVLGTCFLHTGAFEAAYLLPGATSGLFATAVLNINNIRDIESDRNAGKRSVPVRIGRSNAVVYHWFLLSGGWVCAILFTLLQFESWVQLVYLVSAPLFILNGLRVSSTTVPADLDPYLKQMALSTLLFVLLFGLGLVV